MLDTKKGEMSVFWVVLIIIGIVVAIVVWVIFFFVSETVSVEGEIFHTIGCQANNYAAAYGLLRDIGMHFPKPLCDPIEIDINADDCDCEDFTAFMQTENPIGNLYDGDINTYTSIVADKGKVVMEFEVKQVFDYNLTSFRIYIDGVLTNQPEKVEIKIKGEGIFSGWKSCASDTAFAPGWHELVKSDCPVPAKGKIGLVFDTLYEKGTEVNIVDIEMTFFDGVNTFTLTDMLKIPPKTSDETSRKYSYLCKTEMSGGKCSETWKKKWVALKLGKLAASCWSMGLEGRRNPGAFACFGGKIENIEVSLVEVPPENVIDSVSEAMNWADLRENLTYREYLPKPKLTGSCPDFVPYLRSPESFVSWLIPAVENKAVEKGYPEGSRYAIVYADIHIQSVLWATFNPPYSDKIVFC
ncbi:MAG: hypothetical protein JSW73_04835 [Candidatus Woesearchaeota archaeon]|nr:MAG: hypothetical protein JSW73_04835 [Candidatus Woesearchaeota archaeon]